MSSIVIRPRNLTVKIHLILAISVRLSPMDYFQEADWFFDTTDKTTWYSEVYQPLVVAPRLERFGALTQVWYE